MNKKPGRTKYHEDVWTDEQWRVLEPLPLEERSSLVVRAIFSRRGLIAQAEVEGYSKDAGWPNGQAPGSSPRSWAIAVNEGMAHVMPLAGSPDKLVRLQPLLPICEVRMFISDEKFKKLREALRSGATLREAAQYAGVAKGTAFRYRLLFEVPANSQDSWNRKRWKPDAR